MIEIARTIDTLRDQLNKAIQLAIADLTAVWKRPATQNNPSIANTCGRNRSRCGSMT